MNRRSFLQALGLAPITAPLAIAADGLRGRSTLGIEVDDAGFARCPRWMTRPVMVPENAPMRVLYVRADSVVAMAPKWFGTDDSDGAVYTMVETGKTPSGRRAFTWLRDGVPCERPPLYARPAVPYIPH